MNYMAKVAEMLGVELDEEFEIVGVEDYKLKLTEHGLVFINSAGNEHKLSRTLMDLLTGNATIKREPWTPKMGEYYYSWIASGKLGWCYEQYQFNGSTIDFSLIAMGNCFKTITDASAHKDEVIRRYEEIGRAVAKNA